MEIDWPEQPAAAERRAKGKERRKATPRSSHDAVGGLASPERAVELVEEQNCGRIQWLVPERRARMAASPFAFFRGAARVMAADLADTPRSGYEVQACGDAHLSNFGAYASPERRLVFDVNDFDETLSGPWEWDVKRLAASVVIAAEHNGLGAKRAERCARAAVSSYRRAMATHAAEGALEVWYDHLDLDSIRAGIESGTGDGTDNGDREGALASLARFEARAKHKDAQQAVRKLTEEVDGRLRIRNDPPLVVSMGDVGEVEPVGDLQAAVALALTRYRSSLSDDRRLLLDHFIPMDIAVKVVGVGSVGTRCFILLMESQDLRRPMFLQVKEAGPSVLEEHLGPSRYEHPGRRVVEGQRLTQAVSDIFLGWTEDLRGHHYYVRQLKDWKGTVEVESMDAGRLEFYGRLCGATLARGHARSGDRVGIAAYLGSGDTFDRAVATFAIAYAERNRQYHEAFLAAIADGRLDATSSIVPSR